MQWSTVRLPAHPSEKTHTLHIHTKLRAGGSQISREPSVTPHAPWFKAPEQWRRRGRVTVPPAPCCPSHGEVRWGRAPLGAELAL